MRHGDAVAASVADPPAWLDAGALQIRKAERNKVSVWDSDAPPRRRWCARCRSPSLACCAGWWA